jgi:hypothetical protein
MMLLTMVSLQRTMSSFSRGLALILSTLFSCLHASYNVRDYDLHPKRQQVNACL